MENIRTLLRRVWVPRARRWLSALPVLVIVGFQLWRLYGLYVADPRNLPSPCDVRASASSEVFSARAEFSGNRSFQSETLIYMIQGESAHLTESGADKGISGTVEVDAAGNFRGQVDGLGVPPAGYFSNYQVRLTRADGSRAGRVALSAGITRRDANP